MQQKVKEVSRHHLTTMLFHDYARFEISFNTELWRVEKKILGLNNWVPKHDRTAGYQQWYSMMKNITTFNINNISLFFFTFHFSWSASMFVISVQQLAVSKHLDHVAIQMFFSNHSINLINFGSVSLSSYKELTIAGYRG